jgi:hypothetical protein
MTQKQKEGKDRGPLNNTEENGNYTKAIQHGPPQIPSNSGAKRR